MKKVIAILLMVLLLGQIGTFAADNEETGITETIPAEFTLLEYLGIISPFEDGMYHLAAEVNRADMALMVSRLILEDSIVTPATGNVFSDVTQEHWAADYIEMLAAGGYLNGTGGGAFHPDEPAVYEHVMKLLVTALGYQVKAEISTGYPAAYLSIGSGLGLNRDISAAAGQAVTYQDMYHMLYRALLADRFVQTTFGAGAQYEQSASPLLESKFSVYEVSGRVDADEISAIGGGRAAAEDEIRIDGEPYTLAAEISGENLLGVYVKGFAKMTEDEKEIILLSRNEDYEVLNIAAENISGSSGGFGGLTSTPAVVYFDEAYKQKTVTIPKTASIIRNGTYVGRASEVDNSVVIPTFGSIELLENDEGEYDVVRVSSYVYYVIQTLDKELLRLVDKFGNPELDFSRGDLQYTIFSDGEKITFADLNVGDILAVGADRADPSLAEVVQVYRITSTVRGKVTQKSEEEITIDETTYPLGQSVIYYDNIQPAVNRTGTFYLGLAGEIVAVSMSKDVGGYAWLRKLKVENIGLEPQVYAELFTTNNAMEILYFAEKVSVNGSLPAPRSEVGNTPSLWQNGKAKEQLVNIKCNAKGEITEIRTEGAPGGVIQKEAGLNDIYLNKYSLGPKYLADDNTYIFTIPTYDDPRESDYSVMKMLDLGAAQYSNVNIYDVDELYTAGCLVMKKGSTFMSIDLGYRSAALVEEVGDSVNGEELCKRVHVLIDGVFTYVDIPRNKYQTMKDIDGDGIGDKGVVPGDVFLFLSDANNMALELDVLFDSETDKNRMFSEWYVSTAGMVEEVTGNALLYIAHGTVNTVEGNVMLVNQNCLVSNGVYEDTVRPYRLEGVRVYIYEDGAKKPVTKGYLGDVSPGARIFLRGARTILREIIIYK